MFLLEPTQVEADQLHAQRDVADHVVEAGQGIAALGRQLAGLGHLDILFFVVGVLVEPVAVAAKGRDAKRSAVVAAEDAGRMDMLVSPPFGIAEKAPRHIVGVDQLTQRVAHRGHLIFVGGQFQRLVAHPPVVFCVAVQLGLVDSDTFHAGLDRALHAVLPFFRRISRQPTHQVDVERHAGLQDQIDCLQRLFLAVQAVRCLDDLVVEGLYSHAHAVDLEREHGVGLGLRDGDRLGFHRKFRVLRHVKIVIKGASDPLDLLFVEQAGGPPAKIDRQHRTLFQLVALRRQFDLAAEGVHIAVHPLVLFSAAQVDRLVIAVAAALDAEGGMQVDVERTRVLQLCRLDAFPVRKVGVVGDESLACRVPVVVVLSCVDHRAYP